MSESIIWLLCLIVIAVIVLVIAMIVQMITDDRRNDCYEKFREEIRKSFKND